jgi:hypothetical protein
MKVAIVGAGIFGCLAAIEISKSVERVDIYEASDSIFSRATRVNQARLHTGMHYPRSFDTAIESLNDFHPFIERYPDSVRIIDQHYAISASQSKSSPSEFIAHADRLGISYELRDPGELLDRRIADLMIVVPEATFDVELLRRQVLLELDSCKNVSLFKKRAVSDIRENELVEVITDSGTEKYDKVILASYSQNSVLSKNLEINLPTYQRQLCEVALVKIPRLLNIGITLMDGPFWSTMPFGHTKFHTLTNVVFTPHYAEVNELLKCQSIHISCGKTYLENCNRCTLKPKSNYQEMEKTFLEHTLNRFQIELESTMFTVKSIPIEYSSDTDKRPTELFLSKSRNVAAIFSGKIGSALHLSKNILNHMNQSGNF